MRSHSKAASVQSVHHAGPRPGRLCLLLAALACALVVLPVAVSGAAAPGQGYGYKSDIGTSLGGGPSTSYANSVAVSNDDGNVFVMRQGDNSVDLIDPNGSSITKIPTTFLGGEPMPPYGVAVSEDGSALFVVDQFAFVGFPYPDLVRYVSDGNPTPTYTEDSSWVPGIRLADVSNLITDPSTGDLIVANAGTVYRIDSTTGAVLQTITGADLQEGAFRAQSIAVAPNGDIYVVAGRDRIEHLGGDGSSKGRLDIPTPNGSYSPWAIAVNPQNGDVAVGLPPRFVGPDDTAIQIFSATNDLKETIRVPPAVAGENHSLAFSPDGGKLYVALGDGTAHVYQLGTRPGLDAPTISEIAPNGARLTGVVATGGEPSLARFEYCLASDPCAKFLGSDGSSPWHRLTDNSGLSDGDHDTIVEDATGLQPNTKYLVRSYAINEGSQVENLSTTVAFTTTLTPPVVQTGAASATDTAADLAGTIDTVGDQTTYHFEYGTTASYGSRVPAVEAIAGNGRKPRTFTQTAQGLQPGTTYHYRLVATNAAGTTAGEDRTFTTLGSDEVAPRRAYEQVTSPEKNGLGLSVNWGFQASPDGNGIEYSTSAPSPDAAGASMSARYVARRGASGWIGQQPVDPPQAPPGSPVNSATQAVSDDFRHAFVMSTVALTPGATYDAANIYVSDIDTGDYRLVGTATQPGAYSAMTGTKTLNTFIAGAPDFSWVVLISRFPLLPGAPQVGMYKWTETGGLSLASLLPGDIVPIGNTWFQDNNNVTTPLVSKDGEKMLFALTSGEGGVYLRSGDQTIPLSVSQASGGPSGTQPGRADGISRDGRYAIFHSPAQLTDAAPDDGGQKMYRYDTSTGQLEYLGPQDGTADGTADVLRIGADGETVYFNSNGQASAWYQGQLDVVHPGSLYPNGINPAYSSPNGRYLVFVGQAGTVRLYDAVVGEATCISCPLSGPAEGAELPNVERNISNRQPQAVTDDGRAFFQTTQALLSSDRNATSDVYEYFHGRLTMISPGDGSFIATFVDISLDGRDVFFTTAEGLVAQDTDGDYDIYDARVGGGFPEPPPPPAPCSGEACRAASALPAAPSIGSSGSGRSKQAGPRRCGKGARKVTKNGKVRCVKKNHHGKRTRTTKQNRGAGR